MLQDHVKLATRDPDEARAFLADKQLSLDLVKSGGPNESSDDGFEVVISGAYAPEFYIAHMAYGSDVTVDAPAEREDYGFSAPLAGRMAASVGSEMMPCTRASTALASPGAPQTMAMDGGSRRLSISLKRSLVRRRMATLTGEPVQGEIAFEPVLDLTRGPGRLVWEGILLTAEAIDAGIDVMSNAARLAHLEETALSALLLYQPHSHTRCLERPSRAPATRDVRRAIDYIEANLDAPIRLDDLVQAAGVPGRTLNQHFRAFAGASPMAYLRKARLRAVRHALLTGNAPSVAEAAMRFGFLHLGRFSGAYADAFGEPPSATLAQSRRLFG